MEELRSHSLKEYNTFRIDATCDLLIRIQSTEDLQATINRHKPPYFILGGGSNLLISKDQTTTILKNEILGKEIIEQTEDFVVVKIGGGENWHGLVMWALEHGFGGLENLSLIPGTVGASPIQNIGAYGVELDQVFDSLDALNMKSGEIRTFSKEECEFGYRDSIFKNKLKGQFFITNVTYKLTKKNHPINISYAPLAERFEFLPTIREVSDAVIEIRQSKLPDPAVIGNSGSFFKNPLIQKSIYAKILQEYPDAPSYPIDEDRVKVPAGWMIDQAGWKGFRSGDAGVYEKQALVLVNHAEASGPEIWALAQQIIADVKVKFGVELSAEVNII